MILPVNYEDLTPTERRKVRLIYFEIQDGKCCNCGEPLLKDPAQYIVDAYINKRLFPDSFFKYPVHLHHNHDTGMTIGAIHNRCNAYLWQYKGQ